MDEMLDRLGATIKNALPTSVTGYVVAYGELTVTAEAADIVFPHHALDGSRPADQVTGDGASPATGVPRSGTRA